MLHYLISSHISGFKMRKLLDFLTNLLPVLAIAKDCVRGLHTIQMHQKWILNFLTH